MNATTTTITTTLEVPEKLKTEEDDVVESGEKGEGENGELTGEGNGEGAEAGDPVILILGASTTMTSFWPFWHFPATPLMKKKGPDLERLNVE